MIKIISLSLGSSSRDYSASEFINGHEVEISRIGSDGSKKKLRQMLEEYECKADAFGIGGTDRYFVSGCLFNGHYRRWELIDTKKLIRGIKTPVLCGAGIKMSLEREIADYIISQGIGLGDKDAAVMCAVDRRGLAQSLSERCRNTYFYDLLSVLNIPWGIKSLKKIDCLANSLLPFFSRMPIEWLYPTGKKQDNGNIRRNNVLNGADIIAGDFHQIKKYAMGSLEGKIVVTNSVTKKDAEALKESGASCLVTVTKDIEGRFFGTNAMEALFYTMLGDKSIKPDPCCRRYTELIKKEALRSGKAYNLSYF